MSENNPIRVYVSHVFVAGVDYLRVFEYLESVERFYYLNVSDPEVKPSGNAEAFKDALRQQIDASEVMVLLASVWHEKRDWAEFQINAARALEKPILLVNAFGQTTLMPGDLSDRADETVEWNEREMVDAIRRLARNEDTQRWEVIDFP